MIPSIFHLWIPRGSDYLQTFQKRLGITMAEGVTLQPNKVSTIRVFPLPSGIQQGTILTATTLDDVGNRIYSTKQLTATANAAQNAQSLSVTASSRTCLSFEDTLLGPAVDLTGYSGQSQIRARFDNTSLLLTPSVVFPDALNGIFGVQIDASDWDAAQDAAIAAGLTSIANCSWKDLPDPNYQQIKSGYSDELWAKGFLWDVDLISPSTTRNREAEGAVFITDEVSR